MTHKILGMALQSIQQLTGANYFFYYGATVFSSVGIVDPYVTQIILGAVNVVCTFGGLYVLERVCIIPAYHNLALMSIVWATFASDLWQPLAIGLAFCFRRSGNGKGPCHQSRNCKM